MTRAATLLLSVSALVAAPGIGTAAQLAGTAPLEARENPSAQNARQWDAFLLARLEASVKSRARHWRRDLTGAEAYAASVRGNRERLARMVGAVDAREPAPALEFTAPLASPGPLAESRHFAVWPARWPVLEEVDAEGIVFQPKTAGAPAGLVVIVPDADQSPEAWAGLETGARAAPHIARRLAATGLRVVILAPVSRAATCSGDEANKVMTNQPHREWLYRQAAPVGRHPLGYEVQMVRAVIDAFLHGAPAAPVGVMGFGEGGLVALLAGALDERIRATWVAGHFGPRERLWAEPVYRNLHGLLAEFGDAEIASLVAPRALLIEAGDAPGVAETVNPATGPVALRSASPGAIGPFATAAVRAEFSRMRSLIGEQFGGRTELIIPADLRGPPGSAETVEFFSRYLGVSVPAADPASPAVRRSPSAAEQAQRQRRIVTGISNHAQRLARLSDRGRDAFFWNRAKPGPDWPVQIASLRRAFAEEFVGRLELPDGPLRARSRPRPELSGPAHAAHEISYEVTPGVEDWGLLLLPADLKPGERRPVVIAMHGANSDPADLIEDEAADRRAATIYRRYALRLAERGFVVFAPAMPNNTGGEPFRALQRKANPLGLSIFSLVAASQTRALAWLRAQPFVDPARVGYYGMSYGGMAAMRVPAMLDGIAAVVCSGHFNDAVRKMTSIDGATSSVVFNALPEMIEWDLAHRFSHAEMAALLAPRPFMVEHGTTDRVAPVEWVAAEFSRVRRLYARLGVPERAAIHTFEGGHTVMGTEAFAFLHRALGWRAP